jgi:lysophospholipase L1-like esterase
MPPHNEEYLATPTNTNPMTKISLMINSTTTAMFRPLFTCLLCCLIFKLSAQDPLRFKKEIDQLTAGDSSVNRTDLILFAGSSSFRLWKEMTTDFPGYNIVNRGFGGSEMSDLLYYADQLILPYQPKQIFIYEGDNDLGNGRPVKVVMKNTDQLLHKIRRALPTTEVIFLTPKPSGSRWHLKKNYVQFIRKLKRWAKRQDHVKVIDVWSPLLDDNKKPMSDIFMEDKLHLNRKGYLMWIEIINPYLKTGGA